MSASLETKVKDYWLLMTKALEQSHGSMGGPEESSDKSSQFRAHNRDFMETGSSNCREALVRVAGVSTAQPYVTVFRNQIISTGNGI